MADAPTSHTSASPATAAGRVGIVHRPQGGGDAGYLRAAARLLADSETGRAPRLQPPRALAGLRRRHGRADQTTARRLRRGRSRARAALRAAAQATQVSACGSRHASATTGALVL